RKGEQPAQAGRWLQGVQRFEDRTQDQAGVEEDKRGPAQAFEAAGSFHGVFRKHPEHDTEDELRNPTDKKEMEVNRAESLGDSPYLGVTTLTQQGGDQTQNQSEYEEYE